MSETSSTKPDLPTVNYTVFAAPPKFSVWGSIKNEMASRKWRAVIVGTIVWAAGQWGWVANVWEFMLMVSAYIGVVAAEDIGKSIGNKNSATNINVGGAPNDAGVLTSVRTKRTSIDPMGITTIDDTKVEQV